MIYLLETLSIGSDYSPESLDRQSRNLSREEETVAAIVAEIKRRRKEEESTE